MMLLLTWKNDDALVLRGKYMHVCCCVQILNLVFASSLSQLHASVATNYNVMKYMRFSSTRLQTFKQYVEQVKGLIGFVVLDCITR